MAYGLATQIKNDKETGLNNLKNIMSIKLPKDKIPDYSHIGLSNEVLLQISSDPVLYYCGSKEMVNKSK